MTDPGAANARVAVLTKDGCHLCDVAIHVVESVCTELRVGWRIDQLTDASDEVRRRWTDYVPVISVDGEVVDVFRVSATRLRQRLLAEGTA